MMLFFQNFLDWIWMHPYPYTLPHWTSCYGIRILHSWRNTSNNCQYIIIETRLIPASLNLWDIYILMGSLNPSLMLKSEIERKNQFTSMKILRRIQILTTKFDRVKDDIFCLVEGSLNQKAPRYTIIHVCTYNCM